MIRILIVVLLLGTTTSPGRAQETLPTTPDLQTVRPLDIRILVSAKPSDRIRAQDWSRVFQQLGQAVTIASDNGRDTLGVHSVDVRGKEAVRAVGIMDRTGELRFGDRTFGMANDKALKDFFENLKQHGAGGPFRQRPTWGLTNEQFEDVLRQLAVPCEQQPEFTSAVEFVRTLRLPNRFLITWATAAHRPATAIHDESISLDFSRLSTGTALAVGLAQFGLGFRPLPNPQGGVLIEIDVGDESSNLWPTGWKNTQPIMQAVPRAFQAENVDLDEVELDALIAFVAERIDVPHFFASHALEARGIDVRTATYSRKPGRLSPFRLLHLIGSRHRMGLELRTDEAGGIFLWCTTMDENTAWKKRFIHVSSGPHKTDQP